MTAVVSPRTSVVARHASITACSSLSYVSPCLRSSLRCSTLPLIIFGFDLRSAQAQNGNRRRCSRRQNIQAKMIERRWSGSEWARSLPVHKAVGLLNGRYSFYTDEVDFLNNFTRKQPIPIRAYSKRRSQYLRSWLGTPALFSSW